VATAPESDVRLAFVAAREPESVEIAPERELIDVFIVVI
jgi:hypothetical protein